MMLNPVILQAGTGNIMCWHQLISSYNSEDGSTEVELEMKRHLCTSCFSSCRLSLALELSLLGSRSSSMRSPIAVAFQQSV